MPLLTRDLLATQFQYHYWYKKNNRYKNNKLIFSQMLSGGLLFKPLIYIVLHFLALKRIIYIFIAENISNRDIFKMVLLLFWHLDKFFERAFIIPYKFFKLNNLFYIFEGGTKRE